MHRQLVNPIRRLLRSERATFVRVPVGCACRLTETESMDASAGEPLLFSLHDAHSAADAPPTLEFACDYVILATGGELTPVTDDRQLPDGTVVARRRRLREQVDAVMANATSAPVSYTHLTLPTICSG